MAALLLRHPLGSWRPGRGSPGLLPQRPGDAGPEVLGSQLWDPAVLVVALAETVDLAEGLSTLGTFGASMAESVALAEGLSAGLTASVALAESLALAEALGAQAQFAVPLAESVSLAEALGAQATLAAALAESVALSESFGSSFSAVAQLAESVALVEALVARLQLPPVRVAGLELSATATSLAAFTTTTDLDLSTTTTAAAMTSILRTDSDSADTFTATLTRDGVPYSLVGAQSVTLRWRRRGGQRGELALTVTNAAGGIAERAWQATDLEPGVYEVQVRVIDTNGDQQSFPNGSYRTITVLPAL